MFYHIEIIKKIEISSEYIQVFVVYGALYRKVVHNAVKDISLRQSTEAFESSVVVVRKPFFSNITQIHRYFIY